jgi:tRNA pseudouridine13 synthase
MMDRWPRAAAIEQVAAAFKIDPADFQVTEHLDFESDGSGEHLFLQIEKKNLTSVEVADWLAERFSVKRGDVGLAGMKDKHAITTQWFSLPVADFQAQDVHWQDDTRALRTLTATRHSRKLRRGQLSRNHFQIRLKQLRSPVCGRTLSDLATQGVPNYFGPQRFGRDNFDQALNWLPERRRKRTSSFKKGLYLSVLRSYLFNEVLAARVRQGNWRNPVEGDVLEQGRPTGPLWGRGRSRASELAAEIEQLALSPHDWLDDLEHAGVTQQRRRLVLLPSDLRWDQVDGGELELSFSLPPGEYATVLLREAFALYQPSSERA